ncbi:insulin-like peptide receptor [Eupeodes corollae]|uniref:insulin-like peptide receptor n=1 Tax=Eupeodes corollae TaxID=290404 RepID=UPI0024914355|nr:insulin-like peptide receptor [Eupeodes corollae]
MARVAVSSLILVALALFYIRDIPCLISARECKSIDIKNNAASFRVLEGCHVIKGYLVIGLISRESSQSNFSNLTFPELKEITDFFLMHDVRGLTDMKKLFPNLVVIRGRRLFLSYALSVSNMPDLAAIEFRNLIAIQRGHVFIANCPKMCFLKKINWDRLTLTSGENHIFPVEGSKCDYAECKGCDYCWSNNYCQKFENVNLINLTQTSLHCDPQCLGGCYNSSNTGCNMCKGINDHGACVDKCPNNTFFSENYQRCYTKEECYKLKNYLFNDECNRRCPSGYNHSRKVGSCVKCTEGCIRECFPDEHETEITVISLAHAESLKNCQHLRGSLFISIRHIVEEQDLIASFKNLRIVEGYIKVYYSPFLKSLDFLKNLEKIEGKPLENETFGLVLYSNEQLEELWTPPAGKNVEFINGGIYSFANKKLCNKKLAEFSRNIIHNNEKDLLQLNDQDVLCEPVRLYVYEENITHNSVMITWTKNQTADEVEIIYREAKYDAGEQSELDDDICLRVHWHRELMFDTDISEQNSSHYMFTISNLLPYTNYEYLVKTFRGEDYYSARSPIQRFQTKPDLPTAPQLVTLRKSYRNITLKWLPRNKTREVVKYYLLETFEQIVDLDTLDTRSYCEQPFEYYAQNVLEDFDDCCQRKREQIDDEEFKLDMEATFVCSIDQKDNCHRLVKSGHRTNVSVIDAKMENFTINGLKHFTRYTFFLFACNDVGCGSYFMHTDRTAVVKEFDLITNAYSCREQNNITYMVKFAEPPTPNGAVLNYLIQFHNTQRVVVPTVDIGYAYCLSRKQFETGDNEIFVRFKGTYMFNKFSVRVVTTGGGALSKWFDVDSNTCTHRGRLTALRIVVASVASTLLLLLIWFCLKRRWWAFERLHGWRRGTRSLRSAVGMEDRQELVPSLDTVTFRNSRESVF